MRFLLSQIVTTFANKKNPKTGKTFKAADIAENLGIPVEMAETLFSVIAGANAKSIEENGTAATDMDILAAFREKYHGTDTIELTPFGIVPILSDGSALGLESKKLGDLTVAEFRALGGLK